MSDSKSKDLAPDRSRCADKDCPCWAKGCARAEHQRGEMRFTWLPIGQRPRRASSCKRRIDPVTLEEAKDTAQGIVDV